MSFENKSYSRREQQPPPNFYPPQSSQTPTSNFSKETISCESCTDRPAKSAVVYCRQCKGYFCVDCNAQYHPASSQLMSKHVRITLASLLSNPNSLAFPSTVTSLTSPNNERTFSGPTEDLATLAPSIYCIHHPDEELTHYCLECEGVCICSECAIRGNHKDHDVQTLRKSYPEVKRRINDIVSNLSSREDIVTNILSRIDAHKREIQENTRQIKESMKLSFDDIRDKLKKKEVEFMNQADQFMNDQINQLSEFINYANTKQEEIANTIVAFNENVRNDDEVGLLNYYGNNKSRAVALMKDTPVDVSLPAVANRRCYLNVESANKQMDALSGLHLAIASMQAVYSNAGSPSSASPSSAFSTPHATTTGLALPPPQSAGGGGGSEYVSRQQQQQYDQQQFNNSSYRPSSQTSSQKKK